MILPLDLLVCWGMIKTNEQTHSIVVQRGDKGEEKHFGQSIKLRLLKLEILYYSAEKELRGGEMVRFQNYLCVLPLLILYYVEHM